MRLSSALIRAFASALILLLLGQGGAWAESKPCEDAGAAASSGDDANGAAGHNNPCMNTVTTISGPLELYVGEQKVYLATNNSGQPGNWTWTASGVGEVVFLDPLAPPSPCGPPTAPGLFIPCQLTSTATIKGIKQGKVTIKVMWTVCGDSNKFCPSCATYDITVLDNLHSKPPEKMPLGGKYRRVDVHGVPMPDPSPTGEGEQDRIPNMAYTDMYTLAPTYAVTDMAVPMDGGELALEFRRTMAIKSRDYNPDATHRGISYPTQDYLGLGWDTNLSSRVVISTDQDAQGIIYTEAKVIDETGNSLEYQVAGPNFTPDVTHSYNNLALKAKLSQGDVDARGNPTLILRKAHGTTLVYSYAGIFNAIAVGDCSAPTLARFERYFRLESITDRNHNQIAYHYQSDSQFVANHANMVVTSINDAAHPERMLTFDITYSADRDEGQGLDTGWRLNSATDPLGRKTTFAYADSQGLHAQLASVTRPRVEDPRNAGSLVSPVVAFTYKVYNLIDITLDPFNPSHGPVGVNRFAAPGTITDANGHVTTFDYQADWFPTSVYASMGNVPVYQQKPYVVTENTIDGTANFALVTKPTPFRVTTSVVDTRGTSTVFDFTSSVVTGLPTNTGSAIIVDHFTRTTAMSNGPALVADFTWSHDLNGNLVHVRDLSGNAIDFAYHSGVPGDPYDQPVRSGAHDDNLNPYFYQIFDKPSSRTVDPGGLGLVTQYFYESAFNKEVRTIDAELKSTVEVVDPLTGNRTELDEPLGKTTRFAYDPDGFIHSTTDPDGRVTVSARVFAPTNPLAYLTTTTTVHGYMGGSTPDGDVLITSQTIADVMGNQRAMIDPRGFETGNTPADFTTTALFDDLNRQTSVTKPMVATALGGAAGGQLQPDALRLERQRPEHRR